MIPSVSEGRQHGWQTRKHRIASVQGARLRARASAALQPGRVQRLADLGGRADSVVGALYLAGEIGVREVGAAIELERRHWMFARALGGVNRLSSGAPLWFVELPRPMGRAARDCIDRYRNLSRDLGEACPPLVLRELLGAVLEGAAGGNVERVRAGLAALCEALEGEKLC